MATTTKCGGGAPARTARSTEAYRALLASKAGAVGRLEYHGTAAVAEEW